MEPFETKHDVDQWLEAALGQYGKAEPRTGLESRILANLLVERNRIVSKRNWWLASAAVASAAAIAIAVWSAHGNGARVPSEARTSTTIPGNPRGEHPTPPTPEVASKALRHPTKQIRHTTQATVASKREQFPTPTPLSEQEQLLARYVQQFPQRAVLMAKAQTELQKRDVFEMAASWPKETEFNGSEK